MSYSVLLAWSYDVRKERIRTTRAIEHGLGKRYGDLWALRELDLEVAPGTVLGLLGHNGAGKTTAIRLLDDALDSDRGHARRWPATTSSRPPARVRASIGVAAQAATVDGLLTGRANLELIGRLYRLLRRARRASAPASCSSASASPTPATGSSKEYSGGMRRRLDLAASLIADPPVIFLDEPTTGLDPAARRELWDVVRELVAGGTTVLLTTQYLEEADALADDIVVLDHGRAVAHGSPAELKAMHRRRAARGRRRDAGRRSARRRRAARVRRRRAPTPTPRRGASSCRSAGARASSTSSARSTRQASTRSTSSAARRRSTTSSSR